MKEKYKYIYTDIKEKILSKTYKPNEKIPDEKTLMEIYSCSKMTIKKALDMLVMEGLLVRRRGSGSFVKETLSGSFSSYNRQFFGFSRTQEGKEVTSKILIFDIISPDKLVAEKLNLKDDDFVYKFVRVRYVNGKPYVIEETYMPISIITGLKRLHLESSVYQYIEHDLHLNIQSAHKIIRADRPNELDKEYLLLTDYDPVIEMEQIVFLSDGRTFEFSKSRHRYDSFQFESVSVKI